MKRDFAFLVLEEHPYGREMLRRLLEAGFEPALVLEEASEIATVEREKFLARIEGFEVAPTFTELLDGRGVRREKVDHHNRDDARRILEEVSPALLVLGGTRILKPHVFEVARDGALNSHPGLLPEVRGSASVAWAIHRDLPVGCTCHFIEAGIDTGPIVGREAIDVHRGDTYEKLCWATIGLSAKLMVDAVRRWAEDDLRGSPQPEGGTTHKNMPDDMVAAVKQKLAAGDYAGFVD